MWRGLMAMIGAGAWVLAACSGNGHGAADLGGAADEVQGDSATIVDTADAGAETEPGDVRADVSLPADLPAEDAPIDVPMDIFHSEDAGEDAGCEGACVGVECGPDPAGCGRVCGECSEGRECESGACVCVGGTVPCSAACCAAGESCVPGVGCCVPSCDLRECGDDGCGGSCGDCESPGELCVEGACAVVACGGVSCPEHPDGDWTVTCNERGYCEYARVGGGPYDAEIYVPPGAFTMGTTPESCPVRESAEFSATCAWASPEVDVTFENGYFIAKYEVTIGRYRECVADGICSDFNGDGMYCFYGWDDEGNDQYVFDVYSDDHPAVCVDVYGAMNYCIWIGGHLPSEAEWERALKAESEVVYPWSGEERPDLCGEVACCNCTAGNLEAVGAMPGDVSAVGARDMFGNGSELVADCWIPSHDGAPTDGSARTGCESPEFVGRGGSFRTPAELLFTAARNPATGSPSGLQGFRCSRDLTDIGRGR